jgi:methyl-accepting chemotaxis protein
VVKKLLYAFINIFTKLADYVHLSQLKVFHQILIIIGLLLLFLIGEGFSGVGTINSMQKTTTQVYTQNAQFLSNIYLLETTIKNVKNSYLVILFKVPQNDVTTNSVAEDLRNIDSYIQQLKIQLKDYDKYINQDAKKIATSFETVKSILNNPNSVESYKIENYQRFSYQLQLISTLLESIKNNTKNIANNTIKAGKQFSANAKWSSIFICVFGGLFAIVVGLMVATSISHPLNVMESAAKSLARGDLTKDIDVIGNHEAAEAAKGLNQAIGSLRELVRGITEQSGYLFAASKELKEASSETGLSAAQVATSMEELAKASTEETNQISQTVDTVNQLSGLVRQVAEDMEGISAASEKVAQSAQAGQKATTNIAAEITGLFNYTKEVAAVIQELSLASDEISEIVSVIKGIAEQTTLLALNAAIEAARAGEHGQGFSVVADETGKLADQSKQAAKMISDLIVQMDKRTQHAVQAMQEGIERVEVGKNLASQAAVTFEEIFRVLRNNLAQIDAVAKSTRRMHDSNEEVINAISTIAAISEQRLASTQEVSASTEEQSASMEEVTALADNLARIAEHLKQAVAVFEIEKSPEKGKEV